MNRSILIVICDFLLVSLLAFSTVDINKVSDEGAVRTIKTEIVTNQVDSGKDLTAVMRMALDEERKHREQLLGELSQNRETLSRQQTLLGEREKLLSEREQQVQTTRQALQARELEAQRLQRDLQAQEQEAQRLQQVQTNLQSQFAAAQGNIQALNQQLKSTATEAVLSKEQLAAMQDEARRQTEQAAALQQQLAFLAQSNQLVLSEKQRLSGQLQVAEAEKRAATEQSARMQEQVKAEREEKAKLAEGFKALATKSGELAQEVRESRPLTPNTIFNEFFTNRVEARFEAVRTGLLGTNRRKDTETILVTDGTNTFALCHIQDTPLTLWNPGTDWETLNGMLSRGSAAVPIRSILFQSQDPRIILIPVTAAETRELGGQAYRLVPDPYKFQDAVLVGAREGYYGECRFQLDVTTPDYVKLDNSFLKGLFGKFNPSRGDLVFTKNGQLLGIMANSTYCMVVRNFEPAATFHFGRDVREQHTGMILSLLYAQVTQLPFKLQ